MRCWPARGGPPPPRRPPPRRPPVATGGAEAATGAAAGVVEMSAAGADAGASAAESLLKSPGVARPVATKADFFRNSRRGRLMGIMGWGKKRMEIAAYL